MLLKKRGYFFIIDALLGLSIIVIGVFLITSSYTNIPQSTQVGFLADDLLTFLANTKIVNLNNQYAGIGGELWSQGLISNQDNSLLQQASIFYKNRNLSIANKFIQNVTIGIVPLQFRYELRIDNTTIYPQEQTLEHNKSKNATDLLITSKQITFGIFNTSTGDMFGPYKAEVFVWEK